MGGGFAIVGSGKVREATLQIALFALILGKGMKTQSNIIFHLVDAF